MAFHCSKKWLYNIYHFQEFTARDFWLGASSCVADQLNVHPEHSNMSERREMQEEPFEGIYCFGKRVPIHLVHNSPFCLLHTSVNSPQSAYPRIQRDQTTPNIARSIINISAICLQPFRPSLPPTHTHTSNGLDSSSSTSMVHLLSSQPDLPPNVSLLDRSMFIPASDGVCSS